MKDNVIRIFAAVLLLTSGLIFTGCGLERNKEADSVSLTEGLASLRASRVRPIPARPILFPIPRPIFTVDTKPDIDLRSSIVQLGLSVRSQGSRGTCSVFATTFLIEYEMSHNINASLDLSEEFLNYASNHAINDYSDGGFFDELNQGYQKYGITSESTVPYQITFDPNLTVSSNILQSADQLQRLSFEVIKAWNPAVGATDAQLQSVMTALNFGHPVAVGMLWPNTGAQFQNLWGIQIMSVPATHGEVFDGHSVVLVGYKKSAAFAGGGYFILRNSWGTGFGDNGYAYIPFDYLKKYANDLVFYHY